MAVTILNAPNIKHGATNHALLHENKQQMLYLQHICAGPCRSFTSDQDTHISCLVTSTKYGVDDCHLVTMP